MEEFVKSQLSKTVRDATARAFAALQRGDIQTVSQLCQQIQQRDITAVGPHILAFLYSANVGNWIEAVKEGLLSLKTQPQYESGSFDTGINITYADIAKMLAQCADQAIEQLRASGQQGTEALAAQVFAKGLSAHVLGDYETARGFYTQVADAGEPAFYMVGDTACLMYALEHQAGNPEAAKKWLDLDTFPFETNLAEEFGSRAPETFRNALFDEVLNSPKMAPWKDYTSENWYIATDLNHGDFGPRVRDMEAMFRELMAKYAPAFRRQKYPFKHRNFCDYPDPGEIRLFAGLVRGHGHVGPHVHSDCYLVCNLYVNMPDEPHGALYPRAGIEYGKHQHCSATGMDYPRRRIFPETGTMLMWPSYICHGTMPSRANGIRMVVGADLEHGQVPGSGV